MKNLLVILDSNEYIFSLGTDRDSFCEKLLEEIVIYPQKIFIRVPNLIIKEVRNNLTPEAFKEFMLFIKSLTNIDDDSLVPFELGAKYETKGLKPADSFIAAYTEWTGAEVLITENRHFLSLQSNLPFKILNAKDCLELIHSSIR